MSERDELDLQRAKENPGISKAADTPAFFFFFSDCSWKGHFSKLLPAANDWHHDGLQPSS